MSALWCAGAIASAAILAGCGVVLEKDEELYGTLPVARECEAFLAMDANNDRIVTREEWTARAELDNVPDQTFAALDTDGDGRLSPAEVQACWDTVGR